MRQRGRQTAQIEPLPFICGQPRWRRRRNKAAARSVDSPSRTAAKISFQPHSVMAAPIEEKQLHKSLKVSGIALTVALLATLPAAALDVNIGGGNGGLLGGGGSNGTTATVN